LNKESVMRRLVLVTLGVLLSGSAMPAWAQYPVSPFTPYYNPYSNPPGLNPGGGPRLSPYLNLLRGGNPAANYFMGVVPEIDRRRYQAISQAQIQGLELSTALPPINPEEAEVGFTTSITGHPVVFNNTTTYFGGVGPLPTTGRNVPMSPVTSPSAPKAPKAPTTPKAPATPK
jgi:hypothetical protein